MSSRFVQLQSIFRALTGRKWHLDPDYSVSEECDALLDTINDLLHHGGLVLEVKHDVG